jgi:putative CocE/NonD family hydrolase
VGELDFGVRAAGVSLDLREDLTELHRRWPDQRLGGIHTGIDDEPAVRLFVMGRNRWQGFDDWPPSGRRPEPWYLHPGGGLSPAPPADGEPSSAFRLDPERPVPTRGGNLLLAGKYIRGPIEQAPTERHPDVLLFTSAPLQHELEVIGPVRLVAWLATSTLDSDVVARLCDVRPDGRSYSIVDGVLRLRFRHGLRTPTPMSLGQPERVEVDLWSTAHVFAAGHRLRLHICAVTSPATTAAREPETPAPPPPRSCRSTTTSFTRQSDQATWCFQSRLSAGAPNPHPAGARPTGPGARRLA